MRPTVQPARIVPFPPPRVVSLAVAVAVMALGCASGSRSTTTGPVVRPVTATPDRASQEARDADLGMASAVASRDVVAFSRHVSLDALWFAESGPKPGRAAVALAWAPFFAEDGPRLEWAPDRAEAAPSGDLVFTWGPWTFRPVRGEPETGRYQTAWRRDADGKLRAALDGDATPLPPLPATVTRRSLRTLSSEDGALLAEAGLLLEDGREVGHYLAFSRRERGRLVTLGEGGRYRR